MPTKKRKHRDKFGDGNASEFLEALRQYSDHKEFNLFKGVLGFPGKLPLKLGERTIGSLSINWKDVFAKLLFTSVASQARPDGMTEEEHVRHTEERLDAASPAIRRAALKPFYSMIEYMFQYLPTKMKDSMQQLSGEAFHYAMVEKQKERGTEKLLSPTRLADKIIKAERKAILARLPKIERHSSKTKPAWKDDATLMRYAELVNSRRLLVQAIKKAHVDSGGLEGWTDDLRDSGDYTLLKTGIPQSILSRAIRRVADAKLSKRDREPLSIACDLARQELDLPSQKPQTLRVYYTKGSALLKKLRSQQRLAQAPLQH
jgi:hypothetical protein